MIYRSKADTSGTWQINHSQSIVELSPGQHTIYAVAVDPGANINSRPSAVSTFTVSKNFWVSVFYRLNLQTTVISFFAILLTMIWLYQIKKRKVVSI